MSKVAQILTDQILESLNNGIAPWVRPWNSQAPSNAVSGKQYRGINRLLLPDGKYITFNQAKSLGGSVNKGAKGHKVAWYGDWQTEVDGIEHTFKVLRYFTVFNVNDVSGLPSKFYETYTLNFVPVERAEALIARHAPVVQSVEQRAYFRPSANLINMPKPESFHSIEDYYQTFFHELIHWTKGNGIERDLSYANEELVAEIGGFMLMQYCGMAASVKDSVSYCANWATKIKDQSVALFKAASEANKAVEFLTK